MDPTCLACGQGMMEERTGTFHFDPPPNIPGGTIEIENAVWRECSGCGKAIIPRALDAALDDAGRRRRGLLTPMEVKQVRERTGLSQEAMAQLLGAGDKTYTRWETGKSIQNKANDNLIRLLDRNADKLLQLEVERRPDRKREVAQYIARLQSFKGENQHAMAAHGGDLPSHITDELRERLRQIAEQDKS